MLLPRAGGVLFVGDAAANLRQSGLNCVNEDVAGVPRSLERLAALEFEAACFAHGRTIRHGASSAFRDLMGRLEPANPESPVAGDG